MTRWIKSILWLISGRRRRMDIRFVRLIDEEFDPCSPWIPVSPKDLPSGRWSKGHRWELFG